MHRRLSSLFYLILFVSFLLHKDAVVGGAAEGLVLWYRTVLPSLLPFMILIQLMMQTDAVTLLSRITGPLMKKFPGVSANGSFAVIAGFLCGYPMGAKVSAELVKKDAVSREEGAFLLSFCNNTSPMFILSVFLTGFVPDVQLHLPFFLILNLSPLLCGQLFRLCHLRHNPTLLLSRRQERYHSGSQKSDDFMKRMEDTLMDSFHAIIKIGMYMMLFSILIRLLELLIPGTNIWKILFLSSLEITTGLTLLNSLTVSALLRYSLLMGLVSFGGFCALFQTMSVIQGSELKICPYLIEKLVTALATSLLTFLYLRVYLHL